MERDEESGLEYHSARYYLPWLGRWLSSDPIGVQGGINLYEYAMSNPVAFIDIGGNSPQFVSGVAMAALKDVTETGVDELTETNDDTGTFKYARTTHGYGWLDIGNGVQKKVYYNLVETNYYNKYTQQSAKTISTSFFELESEKRQATGLVLKKESVSYIKSYQHKNASAKPKEEKHPVFNRVIGGLKTFGAYLEISAGYALTATGLGAILGVPLILHGADTAISGLRSLADGENHRTFTSEYLLQKGLGLSKGGSEAVDTAIGFLGGVAKGLMKAGQWGLKPLAKWASKQPYVEDFLPYKAVGHTSWGGKITIIPNLGDDAFNVVVHEGTHRFFSPVGTGLLATARQGLKALGHRSQLLTWAEEVIAHGVEFGNFSHGLEYMRYVGQSMYGISRTRLVLEGTLLTGGYLYGNYKLGTAYLNTNDK